MKLGATPLYVDMSDGNASRRRRVRSSNQLNCRLFYRSHPRVQYVLFSCTLLIIGFANCWPRKYSFPVFCNVLRQLLARISGVSSCVVQLKYCALSILPIFYLKITQPLHNLSSLISPIFSNLLLSMCGLSPPFGLMFFCICCSFLFIPVPDPELPAPIRFPLSTSAFSSLSYHPVTVTEPETVIGKIPSEHKRMTFTHVPRVKFSNNLRFPSPLSCSESISFRLSVYLSSLRFL